MIDLKTLVRPNILALKPYSSARDEFSGNARIWLDANENPFENGMNRYPDPHHKKLRYAIAEEKNVQANQVVLGNGSDELIDLIQRTFGSPGVDKILQFTPTFGMYSVYADINDLQIVNVPLTDEFHIDVPRTKEVIEKENPKIIFVCSPNNPTGNLLEGQAIEEILGSNALVVIDEAYDDFSETPSWTSRIEEFNNLIVLQTFSKARAMASARLGMAFTNREIIEILNRIKPPFNVSGLTQKAALKALESGNNEQTSLLIAERKRLEAALKDFDEVEKIFPSHANFLLVRFRDGNTMYEQLLSSGLVTRNRGSQIENCLRITVGTPEENDGLLTLLKGGSIEKTNDRTASVRRTTRETDILIEVNLDDNSNTSISTGIGFYDHMLDQVSKHGKIGLNIKVDGDLEIDEHHTVEDTAIALGEAFLQALGNKRGIERYGYMLPMDDCLAQVALDFGGRAWLEWDANFKRERVGELPTEMFYHFFKSFSDAAKCNLNIKAEGANEHHKIEAIFKAFARAMRMAVKVEGDELPSTKGVL